MDVSIPIDICMSKRLTTYSFRSKLKKEQQYGLYRKYYCSQDSEHRRASKPGAKEDVKTRDKIGMQTYDCQSVLHLHVIHEDDMHLVHIHLIHNVTHPPYTDIRLPTEARQLIIEGLWTNPAHIAARIQSHKQWAHIKTYQVRHV
jgi:hypothetical protein